MSKGSGRRPGEGYEDAHERIFGKKEVQKGRYIQDPITHKLIPAAKYQAQEEGANAPVVHGDMDSFVSPIDGTLIDDRGKLRRHNAAHGVTNSADYSPEYLKRQRDKNGPTNREAKQERVNALKKAMHEHGIVH